MQDDAKVRMLEEFNSEEIGESKKAESSPWGFPKGLLHA